MTQQKLQLNAQKRQQIWYSGKKKRHTIKTQVIIDQKTHKVICTCFSIGKRHDFKLFKESKTCIRVEIQAETDTGYQGIEKLHTNSVLLKKRTKKILLSKEDKLNNRRIARHRVTNEHGIGFIKRFRILSESYRNSRKRFGLRFNLIAGICNFDR